MLLLWRGVWEALRRRWEVRGLGKGGMRTSIIVWSGRFRGLIFRNVGDGASHESVL